MSLQPFINEAISPWMKEDGPDNDIVMSTRIRLARNFEQFPFPIVAEEEELQPVFDLIKNQYHHESFNQYQDFEFVSMADLKPIEKSVLVEKHLISPYLAEKTKKTGVLISKNEQVSVMINEEDHIRMQLYFPGLQLERAITQAFAFDDWLEEKIDYAFDETRGYLTSCPTNVGTGMRASVMMHLPALTLSQKINKMVPAINQLGLVVRGIYGEGSEAIGNIFQISNQVTLGKSELDIIEDLQSVVEKLIEQERHARQLLVEQSKLRLEDRIFRSYGTLKYSRIIESKEAATCLSDLRLGIDVGYISHISKTILNELMILTQPGFLQQYAQETLTPKQRDIRRASIIRERLNLEEG
ncbi:protein-arginine kinase [Paraliobacillus quinghaiensis]|uniref:Protein-arginine kinase n=1 Tax=Paraliobacillus quinghaiensis TaxID=470815 RepID=A0A917TTY1_9BACI|nr:protein arginine kinase [Paraliobacillus quinghaiensis]GGM35188.1 protein-arginine kinase [Paraliobacillus quinghaiensis]